MKPQSRLRNIKQFFSTHFQNYNKKGPGIFIQKSALYATIIGTILTLGFGYLTLRLTIKYGENIDEIKRFDTLLRKTQSQTDTLVVIVNELRKQNILISTNVSILQTQLSISEKEFKKLVLKDSLEKQTNIIKFTTNSDQLIFTCMLIKDTSETRLWDKEHKKNFLKELYDNMHEAIFNPILQEDELCFRNWDGILGQVGNLLSSYPEYSGAIQLQPVGWTKEQIENFDNDVFIDIIKNCCELQRIVFKRILCKYKYHASC